MAKACLMLTQNNSLQYLIPGGYTVKIHQDTRSRWQVPVRDLSRRRPGYVCIRLRFGAVRGVNERPSLRWATRVGLQISRRPSDRSRLRRRCREPPGRGLRSLSLRLPLRFRIMKIRRPFCPSPFYLLPHLLCIFFPSRFTFP